MFYMLFIWAQEVPWQSLRSCNLQGLLLHSLKFWSVFTVYLDIWGHFAKIWRGCMTSNFVWEAIWVIWIAYGTNSFLSWPELWNLKKVIHFLGFSSMIYLINFWRLSVGLGGSEGATTWYMSFNFPYPVENRQGIDPLTSFCNWAHPRG